MSLRPHALAALAAIPLLAACGAAAATAPHMTTVSSPHVSDGRTVAPAGAPYRYTVPAGFSVAGREIEPASETGYRDLSMVTIGRWDLISVKVEPGSSAVGPADEAQLVKADAPRLRNDMAAVGARVGRVDVVTVAAHPGVRFTIRHLPKAAGGPITSATRTLIFADTYNVLVSCQWASAESRARVLRGCAALERSLVLRDG
jgi:hypothetical protein